MSEAGTKIEIEDVLSSIRRLVSQEGVAGDRAAPMRANFVTRRPESAVNALRNDTRSEPVAKTRAEDPVDEADCLVLTPALRVGEAEGTAAAVAEPEVVESEAAETEDLGDELSRLETTIAQMEAAVAESGIAFEPELGDHFEPEGLAALDDADAEGEAEAAELAGVQKIDEFSVEEFIWTRALSPREAGARKTAQDEPAANAVRVEDAAGTASRPERAATTEDDRHRRAAEEDVILEAETLHDLQPEPVDAPVSGDAPVTELEAEEAREPLVAEAAELEEVDLDGAALEEADAVAEFGVEVSAELIEGDLIEAEAEDAEAGDAVAEAPEDAPLVLRASEAVEVELSVEPEAGLVAVEAGEAEEAMDLDLQDAAWDEAGAADWAAKIETSDAGADEIEAATDAAEVARDAVELGLELADDVEAAEEEAAEEEAPEEEADVGAGDAEAADEAEAATLRRAHLADAEEQRQKPEILRSSYETLREEYAEAPAAAATQAATAATPATGGFGVPERSVAFDEDLLREIVADLIREELQGRLGERITQNVRKLVRREIQRALMSREFD